MDEKFSDLSRAIRDIPDFPKKGIVFKDITPLLGPALAYRLGAGFCIVRKPGKLPYETHSASYELEYGTDSLEIHRDAIKPGARVLIVDDLIATGGTAKAACELVSVLGGEVVE